MLAEQLSKELTGCRIETLESCSFELNAEQQLMWGAHANLSTQEAEAGGLYTESLLKVGLFLLTVFLFVCF